MRALLIGFCLILHLQIFAEGCNGPGLSVGNYYGRMPTSSEIGILYFAKYSSYTISVRGNISCGYTLTYARVYLNNVLIASNDTTKGMLITFVLGAYPGTYRVETQLSRTPTIYIWNFEIADNPLGLKELSESQSISVFPNPALQLITIQSEKEITDVNIINSLGSLIYSQTYSTQRVELPLDDYPPGIYYLQVAILGEQTSIKKIVIQ